jgi:hypothetical protein
MRARSILRRVIGVWLMVDAGTTALWFSALAGSLTGRDTLSVVAMVARVLVAALSATAGWLVTQRRPASAPLGTAALALIAGFQVLNAVSGVLPTNLDPAFRWPLAWAYAGAAAVGITLLRRDERD